MFNASFVPLVVFTIEFGDPQRAIFLDDRLRPRAAHGGADEQQLLGLGDLGDGRQFFVVHDGVGDRLQFREIDRLVEFTLRGRRFRPQAEAQRACPVVRRVQEIIEFAKTRLADMAFDDTPAP